MLNSSDMMPLQFLRVGLGDETISVPLFRLAYAGSDASSIPGGFFTTKAGEFGIVIGPTVTFEDAQAFIAEEIQNNLPFLASTLSARPKVNTLRESDASAS